jgi:hypothetical protein
MLSTMIKESLACFRACPPPSNDSDRRASSALAGFTQGIVPVPNKRILGIPFRAGAIIVLGKASRLERLNVDIQF